MKVTSVEIRPANSSNVTVLSFRDPTRQNPYNVKAILGLDADNIVPKFYGVSGTSATAFYNLSVEDREIVMAIALNPDFSAGKSYSDLRDDLYRTIQSSRTGQVQLRFLNEAVVVAAMSGFVTKVEAPQFEQNQEVRITLDTGKELLQALNPVIVDVTGLDPVLTTIVDDISTAPHAFDFEMAFSGFVATFSITNPFDPDWSFEVSPVGGFGNGDVLHFSSNQKDKKLYIQRGPTVIQLADVIAPGSIWPIMFPGDNPFACENDTMLDWVSISYYPTYWGV